jgi:soluble lytic murein transglycosylase-like protein
MGLSTRLLVLGAAIIAAAPVGLPDYSRAESNHQMLSSGKAKASTARARRKPRGHTKNQLRLSAPQSRGSTTHIVRRELAGHSIDGYATGALPLDVLNYVADMLSYSAIIGRNASENGVPASLVDAVIRVESNYEPDKRGKAGEIGLMQIKLGTARALGYSGTASDLFDPHANIQFGTRYLALAYRLSGGDTCGTILRYNAGHGAKRMNRVSAAYCQKVKRVQAERVEFFTAYLRTLTTTVLGHLASL